MISQDFIQCKTSKLDFFKKYEFDIYSELVYDTQQLQLHELRFIANLIPKRSLQFIYDSSAEKINDKYSTNKNQFFNQLKLTQAFHERGINTKSFFRAIENYSVPKIIEQCDRNEFNTSYIPYFIGGTMNDKNSSFFKQEKFGSSLYFEPLENYRKFQKNFNLLSCDVILGKEPMLGNAFFTNLTSDLVAGNDFEKDMIGNFYRNFESSIGSSISRVVQTQMRHIKVSLSVNDCYKTRKFNQNFNSENNGD